jgi:uncharacterized protein YjbI with pentapeptide repeats/plasmid maintenance system antidote protein VapI
MGKRSFQASREGVERLTQAFDKYGKTQDCLATEVGCTRQTVNKFLTGKRISKELFISLCNELNLNSQYIAELESEQDQNSRTFPSMNRPISNNPSTEGTGALTAVVEVNTVQTCITSNTINGIFSITIPGDINSFLKNREKQNNLLNALRILSSDENATISNIEKGSIKITFNVSSDGIKKLEEEPDKIILVARIICRSEGEELDLSDTDLSHVDLSGLDLSGINFSCADLRDANLKNANLENADLDCADLSGANLRGANLKGTSLNDSILNDSIIDDKWLTVWKIVNRSFLDRDLIGADLSFADLSDANLSYADLRDAKLIGTSLSDASLSDASLSDANLIRANLIRANLRFANLIRANLRFANLIGANLSDANLSGANLSDANLSGANLSGANLIFANLIGADLTGTALVFANVGNAHFGSNPGIYEDAKRELKQRGAIFEDSPGDRSKVPTK